MKKVLLIISSVFIGLYLLFLILPVCLSGIAEKYIPTIQTEIEKAIGLKTEIKGIRFTSTPKLTTGVKISTIRVMEPDKQEILTAENFKIKISLIPFIFKKIRVDIIELDNLQVTLGVNSDGHFAIEKYFINENIEEQKNTSDSDKIAGLPFGLKLSNHLPSIKIDKHSIKFVDLSNKDTYELLGEETSVTDFIFNKKIKIYGNGKFLLCGNEQFAYNISVLNRIMPELDINEIVFPENVEKKEEVKPADINVLEILKGLKDNKITANLDADIKTNKKDGHLFFKGYSKINNISVAPKGLVLPPSNLVLTFSGNKILIDSNLYSAKDEVTKISGKVDTADKFNMDLNVKSKLELANVIRIVKAVAETFNIKDLQTVTCNGLLDANFNIKYDTKKIKSDGYLKIPNAKLYYGLYNVGLDNINADIALNNNNLDIKNISLSILNQPLKIYGKIKEDSDTDLHVSATDLDLKGLIVACGQAILLKENPISSGKISLLANINGKLDSVKPTIKIALSNISLKNIPSATTLKLPSTQVDITAENTTFSGTAKSDNIKVINPVATVSVPSLKLNINQDYIEVVQTPVAVEKINFSVFGKIKNYLTEKIVLEIATAGDIKSTLTGDMNIAKQNLNLKFLAPQNSTIIIPMFDKSKLVFRGNTTISGNMMNPILSGSFIMPAISIPEIPVTIDNMTLNFNGAILNGNLTAAKFTTGGIVAQNITSGISLKGENIYMNNLKGNAFDGNFNGNLVYNLSNAKTSLSFNGSGMDAQKAIFGAAGIKNALSGTLSFDTKLSLLVLDYEKMMKSLSGDLTFNVVNGEFGALGRFDNFFKASNIVGNTILKTTVNSLKNIPQVRDTAKFETITGDLSFSNGWANLKSIQTAGPTMAYYVTGKFNLLNATTDVVVLGRLSSKIVALLGPLGDLSADKLFSYIPNFGEKTAAVVKILTQNPRGEKVDKLPKLTQDTSYKDFKVVFNGGIDKDSSMKSFKWLSSADTTQIEKIDVKGTVKTVKEAVNTDVTTTVKNTVESAKKVSDSVVNQAEKFKNSAIEIKNLFNKKNASKQTTSAQTENVQIESSETKEETAE